MLIFCYSGSPVDFQWHKIDSIQWRLLIQNTLQFYCKKHRLGLTLWVPQVLVRTRVCELGRDSLRNFFSGLRQPISLIPQGIDAHFTGGHFASKIITFENIFFSKKQNEIYFLKKKQNICHWISDQTWDGHSQLLRDSLYKWTPLTETFDRWKYLLMPPHCISIRIR